VSTSTKRKTLNYHKVAFSRATLDQLLQESYIRTSKYLVSTLNFPFVCHWRDRRTLDPKI